MFKANFTIFLLISHLILASLGFGAEREYRVLTLPGGGAFGVNELVALAQQEEDLGQATYKTYDQIWAASIGSVIAALLTIPPAGQTEPLSAAESLRFFQEELFGDFIYVEGFPKTAGYLNPLDLINRLSAKLGWDPLMKDTLIPVSILAAEVTTWKHYVISDSVLHTRISSERHPEASLIDAVAASSNVYGNIYMLTCTIRGIGARYSDSEQDALNVQKSTAANNPLVEEEERYFIDSGLRGSMNPAISFDAPEKNAVLYFIGNGWQEYSRKQDFADAQFINFKLKDENHDVFGSWQKNHLVGFMVSNQGKLLKCNIAAAGLCSTHILRQASKHISERNDYKAMLARLKETKPSETYMISPTYNIKKAS